jgi:cation:H+ antiporter
MFILQLLLLVAGFYLLVKSSDFVVEGASSVGLKTGLSKMVIGLTVVALGTSAPELLVSVTSAWQGSTELALGNVVGSNIANILLILGLSSIIAPIKIKRNSVWKEIPFSLLGALVVFVFSIRQFLEERNLAGIVSNFNQNVNIGFLGISEGLILLMFFVIFMYYILDLAKNGELDEEISEIGLGKSILFVLGGLVGLGLGSQLVVDSALGLASTFGLSQGLVGLTIVALGTSLPEIFTSLQAAFKKQSDIIVGNVVGSNIFNIFLILGLTTPIKNIPISGYSIADLSILLGATVLLFVNLFVFNKYKLGRAEGLIMLMAYLLYLTFVIQRG